MHQIARVAIGWIEMAESKGNEDEIHEADDLDCLSEQQVQSIRLSSIDVGTPVNAQCEANDEATALGRTVAF